MAAFNSDSSICDKLMLELLSQDGVTRTVLEKINKAASNSVHLQMTDLFMNALSTRAVEFVNDRTLKFRISIYYGRCQWFCNVSKHSFPDDHHAFCDFLHKINEHAIANILKGQQTVEDFDKLENHEKLWVFNAACALNSFQFLNAVKEKTKTLLATCKDEHDASMPIHPIHVACYFGQSEMLKVLLEINPQWIWRKDRHGLLPIQLASSQGHIPMVEEMLSLAPELAHETVSPNHSLIHMAVNHGSESLMLRLLSTDKKFSKICDTCGFSPIHGAVEQGYLPLIQKLLDIDPNLAYQRDYSGNLPVHKAFYSRKFSILEFFLSKNPNLIYQTDNMQEALIHKAAKLADLPVIKLCLSIDPNQIYFSDINGDIPLHIAFKCGANPKLIEMLINYMPGDENE